ncbi:MAG: hypothetical protein HKN33_05130 [Pyrinomonadaceae bacterium]|nr:hypothetical protein [Pyrinomonadaceae bacterium]
MKVEALNCPNCGAGVADKSSKCSHCNTRLKTMSCPSCYGTIFQGSKFCALCGSNAVRPNVSDNKAGNCPRCKTGLQTLDIDGIQLDECERCEGIWVDIDTFEVICANRENQSAVLKKLEEILTHPKKAKIQYVPCPICGHLMNRNNFAKVSGVIIDTCKGHGVWFDAEELPLVIEFIRKGGLEYSRQKEKAHLDAERSRIKAEQFTKSVDRFKHESASPFPQSKQSLAIRQFIDFILD